MSETEREEINAIVREVLLDFDSHQAWIDSTPEVFFSCVDTFAKRFVDDADKLTMFRYGVAIGGAYERWRQARQETKP